MGILLVSAAAGLACGLLSGAFLGWVGGILPGLVVMGGVYWFFSKRISRQLEAAMFKVQKELQKGPKNIDRAIAMLEEVKAKVGGWQFLAKGSIDGQIGTILFMRKDFDRARPYLERAIVQHWHAKAMLAVLQAKKKDFAAVEATLSKAARYNSKQGLLYSLWAYLLWKNNDTEGAIRVLNQGKGVLGEADPILLQNLLALQNGKKMKMKGYGDQWYQFHLEQHPQVKKAQRGNVKFARR